LLDEPKVPGSGYKALDREGYDDGGVADLTLVIDLEDSVLRRKRGENAYFTALKSDLLPRVTTAHYASMTRRDQKIKLAKLLFSEEDEDEDDTNPSEVYTEAVFDADDEASKKRRLERLNSAKFALRLSTVLREPACASLSLSEISKRYLSCYGKEYAEAALRCADKAIEIASDGFYDMDNIAIEANENPTMDPKYEQNATYPGLSHPTTLKLQALRVSQLCLRSAYLHRGNALAALDRNDEARESYEKVLPMLENEPRCGRLDWERSSIFVNIGNTFSRQGNYAKANEQYDIAEKLGKEHLETKEGNHADGMGIMIVGMRARSFALKKAGKDDDGKKQMREVLELQKKLNAELENQKEKQKAEAEAAQEAAQAKQQMAVQ
jgi:tetratricopeptide (TPR) repeat protein